MFAANKVDSFGQYMTGFQEIYTIRRSHKAKRVLLRIKPYSGLEVVIPRQLPEHLLPDILHQHREWIQQQLSHNASAFKKPQVPDSLKLPVSGESLDIIYRSSKTKHSYHYQPEASLLIIVSQHYQHSLIELRSFIRDRAKQLLPPMLLELSNSTGLSYSKVSVRSQKTRWGSCSKSGRISLNDQLIFLPRDTVEYLMIHELCHTRHMNHSSEFWSLVEKFCSNFRKHDRVLGQGLKQVPAWFHYQLLSNQH